jgi:hypothetical protein
MSPRILAFCICYLSIAIVIFNTIIAVYEIKDYTTHCTNSTLVENQASCDFEMVFALVLFITVPAFIVVACAAFFCCIDNET